MDLLQGRNIEAGQEKAEVERQEASLKTDLATLTQHILEVEVGNWLSV